MFSISNGSKTFVLHGEKNATNIDNDPPNHPTRTFGIDTGDLNNNDQLGSEMVFYCEEFGLSFSLRVTNTTTSTADWQTALTGKLINLTSNAIQTGSDAFQQTYLSIRSMNSDSIGQRNTVGKLTNSLSGASIENQANAFAAIDIVDASINEVSKQRSKLGAIQNRLQHKIHNLDTSAENLQAAENRIRDLDMVSEMTLYTQNNILIQAATSMLVQANSSAQNVLKLLQ